MSWKQFMVQVKKRRTARGYSLREMAKIVGLSPAALSRFERRDCRPGLRATTKIAEFLDFDTDYLTRYGWCVQCQAWSK